MIGWKIRLFSLSIAISILFSACSSGKNSETTADEVGSEPIDLTMADTSGMDFSFAEEDLSIGTTDVETFDIIIVSEEENSEKTDDTDKVVIHDNAIHNNVEQPTAAAEQTEMEVSSTNDDTASTDNSGAVKSEVSTTSDDSTVVHTITSGGTYRLTGSITNQTITVAAGDNADVQLVFDNVTITNDSGPAIYVQSADKVYITLADESINTVSDGFSYNMIDGTTTVDAAIFSKADLTINGSGSLNLNGNYKHGIVSKDDLIITAGNLNVTAQNVALNGKDCVKLSSGIFNLSAGSDGIRSDNDKDSSRGYVYIEGGTLNIWASNDGIQAETVVKANNAAITITTGSGNNGSVLSSDESYKGIKAGSDILLFGGYYTIDSLDDCIHSNNTVSITGGSISLLSGDDGIHADTDLSISGGSIYIGRSYEGLEGSRIFISNGIIQLTASDDGLNAAGGNDTLAANGQHGPDSFTSSSGEISISGGYIVVNASGDGIDSNGSLNITGGIILISGPTDNGNGALDYDGTASISDGVLIALGFSGMAQSITSSGNQGFLACTFEKQTGGTSFLVSDDANNVLVSFTPPKAYECAIVSAPNIVAQMSYNVVVGATVSECDGNGFAQNTSYTGGTELGYSAVGSSIHGAPSGMTPPERKSGPSNGG